MLVSVIHVISIRVEDDVCRDAKSHEHYMHPVEVALPTSGNDRYASANKVDIAPGSKAFDHCAILFALQEGPPVRPYPYLNSGGFIGPADDILALCTKYPEPPNDQFQLLQKLQAHGFDTNERFTYSDQYYWTLVHLLETETVGLDNSATLFEYFGPSVADVWDFEISRGIYDFRAQGKAATSYQRERARLQARLQSPSGAAQVHFATPMTKAAALDLLDEGQLPTWLYDFSGPKQSARQAVQVQQVTH